MKLSERFQRVFAEIKSTLQEVRAEKLSKKQLKKASKAYASSNAKKTKPSRSLGRILAWSLIVILAILSVALWTLAGYFALKGDGLMQASTSATRAAHTYQAQVLDSLKTDSGLDGPLLTDVLKRTSAFMTGAQADSKELTQRMLEYNPDMDLNALVALPPYLDQVRKEYQALAEKAAQANSAFEAFSVDPLAQKLVWLHEHKPW